MSEENVEVFKRGAEAASRRDVEALLSVVDPDVEWHSALSELLGGERRVYKGHDGVREWLRDQEESFSDIRIEYSEIRDVGAERLLAIGHYRARGKASGIEVETPAAWVVEFANSKVSYVKVYFDHAEALEAAGLSE